MWSPLSRLRLDLRALGQPASDALQHVDQTYDGALKRALAEAAERGEPQPTTPVPEVARVLRVSLLASPSITQDHGDFADVDPFLDTLERMIVAAWATTRAPS